MTYLMVALGGALGSVSRYFVSSIGKQLFDTWFPLGTFACNIIGSALIGIAFSYFSREYLDTIVARFIIVGFLGGFTTFSSFTVETSLLIDQSIIKGGAYVALSIMLGLGAFLFSSFVTAKVLS